MSATFFARQPLSSHCACIPLAIEADVPGPMAVDVVQLILHDIMHIIVLVLVQLRANTSCAASRTRTGTFPFTNGLM